MASLEEMANLASALKEEAQAKKDQSQQADKKEEVVEKKEAVEEKVKEPEAAEEEVVEEEVKEEAPNLSERAQARIDGLIERQIEKDKKIVEMEKKLAELESKTAGTGKAAPEYTKEQLIALLSDDTQKQYHGWAYDELSKLNSRAEISKFTEANKMTSDLASSYTRAKEDFPDMADTTSDHWLLANEIYIRKNLQNDPDGQYVAASLAYIELEKKAAVTRPSNEILQKRLDKETGKKGLATVSKKGAAPTSEDKLVELEKAATGKRPGSPEWNKYLAEVERDRLAKKKAK